MFGVRRLRFDWLFGEIARRGGRRRARVASDVQRELIVEEAVRRARARAAAPSRPPGPASCAPPRASSPSSGARWWSRRASPRRCGPGRRTARAGRYARGGRARSTAATARGSRRAGLVDSELFAWRALDALRRDPAAWGGTPVFVYGFDDFTPLELDALETLADRCGVDVTVSLPYEAGRTAFKAVAGVHQELLAPAGAQRARPGAARRPLRARVARRAAPPRAQPVRGRRASRSRRPERWSSTRRRASAPRSSWPARGCSTCCAAACEPGDIAVVLRRPDDYASLLEQVFGAYGIPFSIDRSVRARPHRAGSRPARAGALRRRPGWRAATTCSPGCARRGC